MPMRKRPASGMLSLLSPFLLVGLFVTLLTARHIYTTLHPDTIFEAIRHNDADRVLALLRAGTDPNAREIPPTRDLGEYMNRRFAPDTVSANRNSATPLLAALYSLEHPAANSPNRSMTVLQYNPHPNIAILRALLEHGADVEATDTVQITPLSFAVRSGDVVVVDLLVRHGAKLDKPHTWGSPLFDATAMGRPQMLRYLLDHGINVNVTNGNGETALINTIKYPRQTDCIRLLLERHIHVNARDNFRKTALWYAQHPNPRLSPRQTQHLSEIIALLKQAGAQ